MRIDVLNDLKNIHESKLERTIFLSTSEHSMMIIEKCLRSQYFKLFYKKNTYVVETEVHFRTSLSKNCHNIPPFQ